MRIQVFFLMLTVLLSAVLGSGCINQVPGKVMYQSGSLLFTIRSEDEIPDGVLEVAVFRLENFRQVELSRKADNFPVKAGDNTVILPMELTPGNYRSFIYVSSRSTRFPVVIRDFEI